MCANKSVCQRCLHILKGQASLQFFNLLFWTTGCGPWTLLSQEAPSPPQQHTAQNVMSWGSRLNIQVSLE